MNLFSLINMIFPTLCVHCKRYTGREPLCRFCFESIELNATLFCGACRARLPEGANACHAGFPYLLGAATNYDNDAVQSAIRSLKFRYIRRLGPLLGALLARYATRVPALSRRVEKKGRVAVVPVPLSSARIRERGFNQSELIAESFAAQAGVGLSLSSLRRIRHTKAQSETKSREERRNNVSGCFAIQDPRALAGKTVFLVDDVITSGATAEEAARELKRAGAREVIALIVAKA